MDTELEVKKDRGFSFWKFIGSAILILTFAWTFHIGILGLREFLISQHDKYILQTISQELGNKDFTIDIKSKTARHGLDLNSQDLKKALYVLYIRNMQLQETLARIEETLSFAPDAIEVTK